MPVLWKTSARNERRYQPLTGAVSVDVGIVGGGYTGCSAAFHCAQLGMNVAVVEARAIGYGCSGRNSGNLNPGLWMLPEEVVARLGKEHGTALNRMLRDGPHNVKEIVARFGIDCDLTTSGTLHCASDAVGVRELELRFAALSAQGQKVTLLDAAAVAARTGTVAYRAAIANTDAAWIQPYAYLQGLAGAAVASGAAIYENSSAMKVSREGAHWLVETPSGQMRCKMLLIATGAYHSDAAFGAGADYAPYWYFNFATPPLQGAEYEHIVPAQEGCWDTSKVMVSFTRDPAGRFIIGSVGCLDGFGQRTHAAWAKRKMAQLFPALAGVPFEHGWHGSIDMTAEHLPRVVSLGDNALSVYGYSGRGIAPGTLFGRAAARYFADRDPAHFAVPITRPTRSKLNGLRSAYARCGSLLFHAIDARLPSRRSSSAASANFHKLG